MLRKKLFSLVLGFTASQFVILFAIFFTEIKIDIRFWIIINSLFFLLYILIFLVSKKEYVQKDNYNFFFLGLSIAFIFGGIAYGFRLFTLSVLISKISLILLFSGIISPAFRFQIAQKAWGKSKKMSFVHLKQIVELRTFAFLRSPLFFDKRYELKELSHRRTLLRHSVENLLHQSFLLLYAPVAKLFKNDGTLTLQIENKIGNEYIKLKDENGNNLELGILEYFSDKIARTYFHYYLFKNEDLIASVFFNYKINEEYQHIHKFNLWQYNTVLLNNALAADERELANLNFDKIYRVEKTEDINLLISKLDKKAPTGFIFGEQKEIKLSIPALSCEFGFGSLKLFKEYMAYCRKTLQVYHTIHNFALLLQLVLIFSLIFTNFPASIYALGYILVLILEIIVIYAMMKQKR